MNERTKAKHESCTKKQRQNEKSPSSRTIMTMHH